MIGWYWHCAALAQLARRSIAGAVAFWIILGCLPVYAQQAPRFYEYMFVPMQEFAGVKVLIGGTMLPVSQMDKTLTEASKESRQVKNRENNKPETLFFAVKQKPYGAVESDVISAWFSPHRMLLRRATLSGASVVDAVLTSPSTALLLLKRDTVWTLAETDPSLILKREAVLPVRVDGLAESSQNASEQGVLHMLGNQRSSIVLVNGCLLLSSLRVSQSDANAKRVPSEAVSSIPSWVQGTSASSGVDSSASGGQNAIVGDGAAVSGGFSLKVVSSSNVRDVIVVNAFTRDPSDVAFAYLVDAGLRKIVVLADEHGKTLLESPVSTQQRIVLQRVSNHAVAVCVDVGGGSQITIIGRQNTQTVVVAAKPEHIIVSQESTGEYVIRYIALEAGRYCWKVVRQQSDRRRSGAAFAGAELITLLPESLFSPLGVAKFTSAAGMQSERGIGTQGVPATVIVFQNAVVTLDANDKIQSVDNIASVLPAGITSPGLEQRMQFNGNETDNLYVLTLQRSSLLFQKRVVRLWWLRNIIATWWLYGLGMLASAALLWLVIVVRSQRRLLYALFEMPEADALFIVDNEGKLLTLNQEARTVLQMPPDVPMKRLFRFYCTIPGTQAIEQFVREALQARVVMSKNITLADANSTSRSSTRPGALPKQLDESGSIDMLFSAFPIRTRFGSVKGIMLTGKDITEALEKKRLMNWAQLGHDMQTNLSTIRLNAEKAAQATSTAEAMSAAGRILYQVNLLMKRVRDLIAIGKDEGLTPVQANAAEICLNVRKEFDSSLFPNVDFEVYAQQIEFVCDALKLERAIRNAVENGIRAMNNQGVIRIASYAENNVVIFEVRDSGEGMDADVLSNITKADAKPGFTTFREKGGSGMGTMIMRHILQLHNGEMKIRSERGKGTTVQFRVPARGLRRLNAKPLEMSGMEVLE